MLISLIRRPFNKTPTLQKHTNRFRLPKNHSAIATVAPSKLFAALFALTVLASCANNPYENFKGETLIQPLPLPESDWQVTQHETESGNIIETRWNKDASQDMVQTFVMRDVANASLETLKANDDNLGKASCDEHFQSQVLSDHQQNGYPQLTWFSECEIGAGLYIKTLHKSILGNDSHYLFKRIFRTPPKPKQWQTWLDYVNRIQVCDNRTKAHPCPSNFPIKTGD
ncbi:hypothetical protein [Alteromonas sp. a30]|uniref:hypothetical protein n=1 Tax=Alteromonas sp. a30 TaxID=2730917 RepID=UPI00227FE771|nr:hypothetical protein [Alteromonas sp. a30]MCY7296878.1 hypothetical protein [Alteromonas sp. a30]